MSMDRLDVRTAGPDCGLAGVLSVFTDFPLYSGSLIHTTVAVPPLAEQAAAKHALVPGGGEQARVHVLKKKLED